MLAVWQVRDCGAFHFQAAREVDACHKRSITTETLIFHRIKENMWVNVPRSGNKKAFWLFNSLP